MEHRKTAFIVLLAAAIFAVCTHCLFAQTALFADAFGGARIGDSPEGWIIQDEFGTAEIIADPQSPSGRILRVIAPPRPDASPSQAVIVRTPQWKPDAQVTAIAVEFMVNWRDGSSGIYHYISKDGAHRVILPIYGGKLLYKPDGPMLTLAELDEGWNRVRVVADSESDEVFVYLNDMDKPVAGPLSFRRPIDSWTGTQFIMRVEAHTSEVREMLYGDVKVFAVPPATSATSDAATQHTTGSEDQMPRSDWKGYLRPTAGAIAAQTAMPFYQALPVRRGELYPGHIEEVCGLSLGQDMFIPASLSPAALWPDGSIRWLAVDGVWPSDLTLDTELDVYVDEATSTEPLATVASPPIKGLAVVDDEVHLVTADQRTAVVLAPVAAYTEITEPKVILPDSVPDDERQYAWAEPLKTLNSQGQSRALDLRIREHVIEKDNHVYTVHRLRGDAGDTAPGNGFEWQLRVRIYKDVPVVRLQMSWALHRDPQKYALTQAAWVARFANSFNAAYLPGITSRMNTASDPLIVQADPTGRGIVRHGALDIAQSDWPDAQWHVLLVETGDERAGYLGIGTPNLTRLGPNHIGIDDNSVTLASWSDQSGLALDLRPTANADEFGMAVSDADPAGGVGVMLTLESSLVWSSDVDYAETLARLEAVRDTLWLPSQQDITATESLGPISPDVFDSNREYFTGVSANIHFVLSSRDHWRWTGAANFGDIRTNFGTVSAPERGLHPGRWALYGRYGWRKGAAEPYDGMWITGLLLGDRDIALAAFDYALHVANVDVAHGSFFAPWSARTGGMHRRNKDHWSGSIQMQYTPSSGLYLTKWLTGHELLEDTLKEVRHYAKNQGSSGSAFAASAWIHRYMETHNEDDLQMARVLLDQSAKSWEAVGTSRTQPQDRWGDLDPNVTLRGLDALYMGNFRLPTNGIPTLIEFYEATNDRLYLETIRNMLQAHGIPAGTNASLGNYYGLAYLLASGFSEEDIGLDIVNTARQGVARLLDPPAIPARRDWDYETLMSFALQTGATETTSIGWRAEYAPVVMSVFGHPPMRLNVHSPRAGAVAKKLLPVELEWVNPAIADGLIAVALALNNEEIYSGSALPAPGEVVIDTTTLEDGRHRFTVTASHERHGSFEHSLDFQVWNRWTLIQDMTPPITKGWFGEIDYLQTARRSDGWTYTTDDGKHFFGDEERLVRAGDTAEYLIWETPQLIEVSVTLFSRPQVELSKAVELAVSSNGEDWQTLAWQAQIDDGEYGWQRARITLDVRDRTDLNWFRLQLSEATAKDAIQIGQVNLSGYRDE